MSVVGQLLVSVLESLKAKKSHVYLQDEEVLTNQSVKLFATMQLGNHFHTDPNPKIFPKITSSLFKLPTQLFSKFRTIGLSQPDVGTILKLHLLLHKFTFANELACDLASFFSLWLTLANPGATASIRVMCSVISEAGVHREKLSASDSHADVLAVAGGSDSASEAGSLEDHMSATEAVFLANSPDHRTNEQDNGKPIKQGQIL